MRAVRTIAGVVLLLYGWFCAGTSLRNLVMGPPAPSYGFSNPWPFVMVSLLGLGLALLGALLLSGAWGGGWRRAVRP